MVFGVFSVHKVTSGLGGFVALASKASFDGAVKPCGSCGGSLCR